MADLLHTLVEQSVELLDATAAGLTRTGFSTYWHPPAMKATSLRHFN
ncbi:hypothetical protein ACX80T_10125 [Arthrobacter sp. Sr33]